MQRKKATADWGMRSQTLSGTCASLPPTPPATGLISILFPTILTAVCAALNGNNAQGYFICMGTIGVIALPLTLIQYFYARERVTEERRNQVGMAKEDAQRMEVRKEASMWTQLGNSRIDYHRRMAEGYHAAYLRQDVQQGATYDARRFAPNAVYWLPYFGDNFIDLGSNPISVQQSATMEATTYCVTLPDWGPLEFKEPLNKWTRANCEEICVSDSHGLRPLLPAFAHKRNWPFGLRFRKRRKSAGSGAPSGAGIPLEGNPDGFQDFATHLWRKFTARRRSAFVQRFLKCWHSDNGFAMKTHFGGHDKTGKLHDFFAYGFVLTNEQGEIIRWETHVSPEYNDFLDFTLGVHGPFKHGAHAYMAAVAKKLAEAGQNLTK